MPAIITDVTLHGMYLMRRLTELLIFLLAEVLEKEIKLQFYMMNCLEWLPIYFGILKTGALAVPMNFRFDCSGN